MTDPPNVGHVEMKSPQIEIGGTLSGKGRRSVQLISKTVPDHFLSIRLSCALCCAVLSGRRVRTCPCRVVRESAEAVWVPTARSDSPSSRAHLSLLLE